MAIEQAVPNLPVKNIPASIQYYRDILGFKLLWDDAVVGSPEVMYACLRRDAFKICLTAHPGPGSPAEIWGYVSDIESLYEELKAKGAHMPMGLEQMSWGEIELSLKDPDGNRICFTQRGTEEGEERMSA
jgi:catechol 2,3-dioxygenase-like lactoylglutathione lyase family enzyme